MTLLEVIQFVGYSTGAALHLWMGVLLLRARRKLSRRERVLLVLTLGFGLWHAANFIIALHIALGLSMSGWAVWLRAADTLAVVSVTLSYSFLLHVHLHLWADAHGRGLKFHEKIRVYTSYTPALFLWPALRQIWTGDYAPLLIKLAQVYFAPAAWFGWRVDFVTMFALWAGYTLTFVATTELLLARLAETADERRSLQGIALSFLGLGFFIAVVYLTGLGQHPRWGQYLRTLTNLGSLLPSALIAYYIYRYRYLALKIQESLIIAVFAGIVLTVYLYGIRVAGAWFTAHYGARPGVIESLLTLALALAAAPLRGWLEQRVRQLFEREATLYRDVVARIGTHARPAQKVPQFLRFVEAETVQALGLRRCYSVLYPPADNASDEFAALHAEALQSDTEVSALTAETSLNIAKTLKQLGFDVAYPLRNGPQYYGLMLIDAAPAALHEDTRAVLEVLARQVALALESSRLFEENLALEKRLAHGERLAALGQMAATVAHEIKNPLSAIKSIAQAMQEDDAVTQEYGRDLSLIIGETDRLSRSLTQLLSFARTAPPDALPCRADELLRAAADLFRQEARQRGIELGWSAATETELDGLRAAAVRDALANLLANALSATPTGGRVQLSATEQDNTIIFSVADTGAGIPAELRERIWQPFFTTRQRGTGLGLAIVRKRLTEAGGTARLVESNDTGACFELVLPLVAR